MPKGEKVAAGVYRYSENTFFWRVQRMVDGEVQSASGTEPSKDEAILERQRAILYFKDHGYFPAREDPTLGTNALSLTVDEAVEQYLDQQIKFSRGADTRRSGRYDRILRPTTIGMYRNLARTYIHPVVGAVRVQEFTRNHATKVLGTMADSGINPTTQGLVRSLLASALDAGTPVGRG